ncbi:MAG: shc, partial [Phenylobacterium sp.]|nr:shc [Phenylobacterium sp.]
MSQRLTTEPTRPDEGVGRASQSLDQRIADAAEALLALQRDDGHWVFELEADATIPSEYLLLRHFLGEPQDLELEQKIGVYLRRRQGAHGGWPLAHGGAFDISAS